MWRRDRHASLQPYVKIIKHQKPVELMRFAGESRFGSVRSVIYIWCRRLKAFRSKAYRYIDIIRELCSYPSMTKTVIATDAYS
ncbi:hypothetical protein PUN28_010025 [Cardiocondyla obscurior]|uniref:Transposase n=1 Tax=Cardiocondyla obscurior TaxID=286306 RepID=A0AAW2FLH1_9HYME